MREVRERKEGREGVAAARLGDMTARVRDWERSEGLREGERSEERNLKCWFYM